MAKQLQVTIADWLWNEVIEGARPNNLMDNRSAWVEELIIKGALAKGVINVKEEKKEVEQGGKV